MAYNSNISSFLSPSPAWPCVKNSMSFPLKDIFKNTHSLILMTHTHTTMMNNGGQSLFVLYTWITLNWPPLVVPLVHMHTPICKAIPFHLYYHLLYYHATFPLSTTCTLWFLSTDTHTHMYSISTCISTCTCIQCSLYVCCCCSLNDFLFLLSTTC